MTEVDVAVLRALQHPQEWLALLAKENGAACMPLCCVKPAPVCMQKVSIYQSGHLLDSNDSHSKNVDELQCRALCCGNE